MSQVNSQVKLEEIRELLENGNLTDGEILQIVQKVLEVGDKESRFILRLKEFVNYCHPSGVYRQEFHVVYGSVRFLQANKEEDSCTKETEYILIPETRVAVIIEYWNIEDYYFIYVFSPTKGWLRLSV